MPYTISKTDGQTLVVIPEGVADTTHSSLTLFGKNYAGYGPILDTNFVKLLENFSFGTAPTQPLQGQLWWDSTNKTLKVRRTNDWKTISGPTVAPSPPSSLDSVGDLWFDSDNYQLKVNTGFSWEVVGPNFTAGQGVSGAIVADIPDVLSIKHTVVLMYVGGIIQAVMSKDNMFTTDSIVGFNTIYPGWNLLDSCQYYGKVNNALNLGGVSASDYLRSDVDDITSGNLTIANNDGLTIGTANDFSIKVDTNATKFVNNGINKDTEWYSTSDGVSNLCLKINGTTGLATVKGDPTSNLGISTKQYVDNKFNVFEPTVLKVNGSNALSGNIVPNINNAFSIGSAVNNLSSVYSQSFVGNTITAVTGSFNSVVVSDLPGTLLSATNKQYVDDVADWVLNTANAATITAINNIVGNVSSTLNTFSEFSNAINNNPNFGNVIVNELNLKAPLSSPSFVGTPIAPTVVSTDVSNKLATTAFVHNALSNFVGPASFGSVSCGPITISNVGFLTEETDIHDIGTEAYRFNNIFSKGIYSNVMIPDQPNITSVGTLTELTVEGNTSIIGNLSITGVGNVNAGPVSIGTNGITVSSTDTINIGEVTSRFNNIYTKNIYGNVLTSAQPLITSVGSLTNLNVNGDTNIVGNLVVSGSITTTNSVAINDLTITLAKNATTLAAANNSGFVVGGPANATFLYSSVTNSWNSNKTIRASIFDGTATRAYYADLAENYLADNAYEPGTVVVFGGELEVTQSTETTTKVAGVISTNPAYLMNTGLEGEHVVAVALQGRCPVKAYGPVKKGDCMVAGPHGRAIVNNTPQAGTIIGKACQDFNEKVGIVEVSVGRS
jgi:hypothetical protein